MVITTCSSAAIILLFITNDWSGYTISELQKGLRAIVIFSGGIAAVGVLTCNVGKLRNIFSANAADRVERFAAIKKQVESQIDTTESLLVKHNLITKADVERRRAEEERQAATASSTSSTG